VIIMIDVNEPPTDEFDALARLRQDIPAMSHRAQVQARLRLMNEIRTAQRRPRAWRMSRRAVIMGVAAASLGVTLVGVQLTVVGGQDSAAQAATLLNNAATVAGASTMPTPRKGQFVYLRVLHVTSGMKERAETWTSADGSQPGLTRSSGAIANISTTLDRYNPATGLRDAPYLVLAKLPTDPDALLKVLSADPAVATDVTHNKVSRDVAIWGLIRNLVENAPPAQKAALFKAAAKIHGITYVPSATDAAGRSGEAVGLPDPRLGTIQFIFTKDTHVFLGERILARGSATNVEFNDTIETIAVVDKVLQTLPGTPTPIPTVIPTGGPTSPSGQPTGSVTTNR
jgi:hypothetical protein